MPQRFVGTAGWNIPRAHSPRFPPEGSHLYRYAARLNAAEINTSFYRPHATTTYERWAAAVPPAFRFAAKLPKVITHDLCLTRPRGPLMRFLEETTGLGGKRGPILVQLPPSLAFDASRVGRFFDLLRRLYDGPTVCEPRHASWTTATANRLLVSFEVARVGADPPRAAGLDCPGGWPGIVYYRCHGSPRTYFSSYPPADLERLATATARLAVDSWCIFDNTGSGAAAENALDLMAFHDRPQRTIIRTS